MRAPSGAHAGVHVCTPAWGRGSCFRPIPPPTRAWLLVRRDHCVRSRRWLRAYCTTVVVPPRSPPPTRRPPTTRPPCVALARSTTGAHQKPRTGAERGSEEEAHERMGARRRRRLLFGGGGSVCVLPGGWAPVAGARGARARSLSSPWLLLAPSC